MSRILRLMALCCAALCSQMTFAQPRVIGIDELFRLAEEQSMSIRSFESGAAVAAEGVRAARAERLPDVGVTVSASFLGDGRLWDRSFGEGMKVDIPHFGNNFALEAQQVVYAGGAVRSGIRMAELEQRDAETSLERNRQDICFLLLGHYLNLYKADNRIRVLRENLALTEQVLETMRARREQGTVLQNDITRYELRREQLRPGRLSATLWRRTCGCCRCCGPYASWRACARYRAPSSACRPYSCGSRRNATSRPSSPCFIS